jgi:SAM-dependent methyltransferase
MEAIPVEIRPMDRLLEPMGGIRPGMSGRRILPEMLSLVVREGVMATARALSVFGVDELCEALHRELGYDLSRGNRRRMIRILVDLLVECGWLEAVRSGDRWSCRWDGTPFPGKPPAGAREGDGQVDFLRRCLRIVPGYLRGEDSPIAFDAENMRVWEEFLGCDEFQACRSVLLDRMASNACASASLLDLCHGPGWGIERAMERWPEARITAIDFTDAFTGIARERAERAGARNAARGLPSSPVEWFGPSGWKGFGHLLPFPKDSFGGILFSCGDPYIQPDAREAVYADLRRVLAPGGMLGILTRGYPDRERLHVDYYWLRVSALIHDFAESVCAGWHGFPDARDSQQMFTRLGFRGAWNPEGAMSVMGSAVWILKKG